MNTEKYNGQCAGKDSIADFITDLRKLQEGTQPEQLDESRVVISYFKMDNLGESVIDHSKSSRKDLDESVDLNEGTIKDPDGLYDNDEYMFFVCAGNTLVSGWEYKEDAQDDAKENKSTYEKTGKVKICARKTVKSGLKEGVGVPVKNALKMLLAAGLEEDDLKDAAKELDNNSGVVVMDKVKKVAKKYGLTLGSDMFKEELEESVIDHSKSSRKDLDDLAAHKRAKAARGQKEHGKMSRYNADGSKKSDAEIQKFYESECEDDDMDDEELNEVSPPSKKSKEWLEDPKVQASFKDQYGDKYKEVMFATAWKNFNEEYDIDSLEETILDEGFFADLFKEPDYSKEHEASEENKHEILPGITTHENSVIGRWVVTTWKNKTKSEWYATARNIRTHASIEKNMIGTSRSDVIKQIRAEIALYNSGKKKNVMESIDASKYKVAVNEDFNADLALQAIKQLASMELSESTGREWLDNLTDDEKKAIFGDMKAAMKIKNKWQFLDTPSGIKGKLFVGTKDIDSQKITVKGNPFQLLNYNSPNKALKQFAKDIGYMAEEVELDESELNEADKKATRIIRNKKTGKTEKQTAHLVSGEYKFLPVNDNWEIVKESVGLVEEEESKVWSPEMETVTYGKNTFILWKHKSKSEWYGISYITKTGETMKTVEVGTGKNAVVKALRDKVTGGDINESVECGVEPQTVIANLLEKYHNSGSDIECMNVLSEWRLKG